MYNEEKTIIKLLNKILNVVKKNYEIIVVDDGSKDNSYYYVKKLSKKNNNIKLISHKKNLGKGAAIKTAKKYVSGDIVIIQDADLEYDPNDYKKLIRPIVFGNSKVVYGSRVLGKKRYFKKDFTSKFRVFANHFLTILSNFLNSQNLTDAHTCYKVFVFSVFNKIKLVENGFEFCPEITTKLSKKKIDISEVAISYKGRSYDEGKKIKLIDGFKAIKTLIKFQFIKS